MKNIISSVTNNKINILVFFLTLIVFSSSLIFQNLRYEEQTGGSILNLVTGDEPHYLVIASNLIYNHSIFIDEYYLDEERAKENDPNLALPSEFYENKGFWHGSLRTDGHFVSGHSPGIGYIITPAYALAGIYGAMFTISLFASGTAVIIFNFTKKITNQKIGLVTSLIFSFGTLVFTFSNQIYPSTIMSFLLILSTYLIFEKKNDVKWIALTGFVLGLGIIFKLTFIIFDIILIPLIIFFFLKKEISKKSFLIFISLFIIAIVIILIHNFYYYENIVGNERTFGLFDKIFGNVQDNDVVFGKEFDKYRQDIFIDIFLSKAHGIFIFSPIIMMFVLGIVDLGKRNKILLITILTLIILITMGHILSSPIAIVVGLDPPARYFIPIIPLLSIPFAVGLYRFSKNWIYRGLMITLGIPSFVFAISFAYDRVWSLGHLAVKMDLVKLVYQDLELFIPALGPANYYGNLIPHSHLSVENAIFIFTVCILLLFGTLLPFFIIKKSEKYKINKKR